ncbi:MAG: hypothetical protein KF845_10755 [Cyclobacteriaceae bacterium]|nr:hypothetical protein [Cyclobacteriaceae bacterium]
MKFNLIIAFLAASIQIFASSPTTMAVMPNETTGIYKVVYQGLETGKVKTTILNSKQQVVFSEVITNVASFIRPYNFNGMEAGEYTIVLEDKFGKQVEKVSYKKNKIESTIHVAKLTKENGKFLLTAVNNGTETIRVNIYDSREALLYTRQEIVTGEFALVYNLNGVRSSSIRFEIIDNTGKITSVAY